MIFLYAQFYRNNQHVYSIIFHDFAFDIFGIFPKFEIDTGNN